MKITYLTSNNYSYIKNNYNKEPIIFCQALNSRNVLTSVAGLVGYTRYESENGKVVLYCNDLYLENNKFPIPTHKVTVLIINKQEKILPQVTRHKQYCNYSASYGLPPDQSPEVTINDAVVNAVEYATKTKPFKIQKMNIESTINNLCINKNIEIPVHWTYYIAFVDFQSNKFVTLEEYKKNIAPCFQYYPEYMNELNNIPNYNI